MENVIGSFIPIIAIIFTFGIPGVIIFWYINARHRERMRLIEKGLSPEEIKQYFSNVNRRSPYSALKWGMLLAFVGLGFFISELLVQNVHMPDSVRPASILFFAGIGFLVYYMMVRNKQLNGVSGDESQT